MEYQVHEAIVLLFAQFKCYQRECQKPQATFGHLSQQTKILAICTIFHDAQRKDARMNFFD